MSSTWFPPLAPAGAQQALAPMQTGARQGSAASSPQAGTFGQLTPADSSQSQTYKAPNSPDGVSQLGGSSRPWRPAYAGGGGGGTYVTPGPPEGPVLGGGGYAPGIDAPMRPLLPAEAQSASSLSSTIAQTQPGDKPSIEPTLL